MGAGTLLLAAMSVPIAQAALGEETAPTTLTVDWTDPVAGTTGTWHLKCDPPGGDHPQVEAACAVLDRADPSRLQPAARDEACLLVYGGPQRATVTGTWRGRPVDVTVLRADGCGIGRWEDLTGLLPAVAEEP